MMNVEIPRADEELSNYPCWVPVFGNHNTCDRPVIVCKCGELCEISNHSISNKGVLSPSFHHNHPKRGCGWHVFITMKDYDWGPFGPLNIKKD